MKYRVFELSEKGNGPSSRFRMVNVSSKPTNSWERVNFEIARFDTPEEAMEAIKKDAYYPSDCIIVACAG